MYPPDIGKGEFRTRSVAVRTEGSDKFKVAGFNKEETHQNIGLPVRWTDPCTNRQRFATASYVRGVPCSPRCWECHDGQPTNLRGDIPVATRATVTIEDNTGTYVIPVEACFSTDCGGAYQLRCYGWLGNPSDNCGDCAHVFPSDEPAGVNLVDMARWRGYKVVNCANCLEKDIHYSVEAGIDCWINDPTEPCNREYYLWVQVYIQPRTYLGCPPIYSCIEDTFDGPLCYDPPQPPPPDIHGCSSYRGCVKLDKYEELCGVFRGVKELMLRCIFPSDKEGNCGNPCIVLAKFGKPGTEPYCVPCWGTEDDPLTCADGMTQDTPRRGVDIAKSLKMVIRSYLSAASATSCCRELIENTEVILESCTQPDGCVIETVSECEPCFIPAEATRIARWRDATRSYVVETTDCGEAVLLMSAQADIYCWLSGEEAVTTCYGVRVSVCIATSIDSEDECCSEEGTVHCMHYVGCAELAPLEQCGANGRFWDIIEPIIVELTCAEDPNCAPCTMQVELTTNENLLQ